jgi:hypothetical protein
MPDKFGVVVIGSGIIVVGRATREFLRRFSPARSVAFNRRARRSLVCLHVYARLRLRPGRRCVAQSILAAVFFLRKLKHHG